MITAENESIKLLKICFVSSCNRELAKLIAEQNKAIQAQYFSLSCFIKEKYLLGF